KTAQSAVLNTTLPELRAASGNSSSKRSVVCAVGVSGIFTVEVSVPSKTILIYDPAARANKTNQVNNTIKGRLAALSPRRYKPLAMVTFKLKTRDRHFSPI